MSWEIDEIAVGLASPHHAARDAAGRRLWALSRDGLSLPEGIAALRAAARQLPAPPSAAEDQQARPGPSAPAARQRRAGPALPPAWADPSARLVLAAGRKPYPQYVPHVVELYPGLSRTGRCAALEMLGTLGGRDAAEALLAILAEHAPAGRVPDLPLGPLLAAPERGATLFPELLSYAGRDALAEPIYRLWLACRRAGTVPAESLAPWAGMLMDQYARVAATLGAARDPGAGCRATPQTALAGRAALLIEMLGYLWPQPARVGAAIRSALDSADARLKVAAVAALLQQGQDVRAAEVAPLAALPAVRGELYEALARANRLDLFPMLFLNQAAFAEAALVQWLSDPAGLGRAPDAIQLMQIVPIEGAAGTGWLDFYLFRFRASRPHWAAARGWLAGVAGPFPHGADPRPASAADAFSALEPWDEAQGSKSAGIRRGQRASICQPISGAR